MPNVELSSIIYEVLSKATAFTTALRFDQLVRTLDAQTVTGPLTFTRVTGLTEVRGSVVNVRLTADGSNLPNLSAFQTAINSGDYDNRAGAVNDLTFWYNGFAYWVAVTQPVGAVVLPPPDTTAPILQSAALDASNFSLIRLTYNEVLNSTNIPATSAFTASGNTISSVAIAGSIVSITLGTALAAGASTTLAYTVPGSNRIQDTSGNAAIAFSQTVTRSVGADTTAPVLQTVGLNTSNYAQIFLTYNETLSTASIPAASAFTLTGQTVSSVAISGSIVTVTLSAVFPDGATGTLAYTPPGTNKIQDAAGNAAIAFSQTVSRSLAARDYDFRGASTLDPAFTTTNLTSSSFSSAGFSMAAPATDWGQGLLIGPSWNPDRVLSIFLVTPNSTTKNYGAGLSPTPQNWLNRPQPPDTLITTRGTLYYNGTNVKSYTTVTASTRMRVDYTKVGDDIRIQIFRWSGTAFVAATNGDYTSVGSAIAAGLSSAKIFVDAYQNDITVERITN